ncbi:hypothetical protein Cgig2_029132 [Carnegiea gigantea]|uniref:Reverse transcriptase zinc-binding domain-containing protein n=1 Tax=Carnegiea gigantea TaxID=171969 RepID=A0A9Q1KKB5_9CARY|nr:hypothetical protein Cgig2_029132 [Carnegiea gigantea]
MTLLTFARFWLVIATVRVCEGVGRERGREERSANSREVEGLFRVGLGYAVGDGRRAKFWMDRWLDGMILITHAIQAIPDTQLEWPVRAYWNQGSGWKWDRLTHLLPDPILQRIASVELVQEAVEDEHIWVAHPSGNFKLKTAIAIIRNEHSAISHPMWKWTWMYVVPHRIQIFLWLILHGRFLTNATRFQRKMATHPYCEVCPTMAEDLEHVL